MEREDRDFGTAIETEWRSNAADATIHVELRCSQMEQALYILASSGRKPQRTEDWQLHLTAVGMTAQNQGGSLTGRMQAQLIDIVRGMAHQDDRFVGDVSNPGGDRQVGVRLPVARIVEPGKPEPATAALNGNVCIAKHGHPVVRERLADVLLASPDVVIAEYRVSLFAFETAQEPGALPGGVGREFWRQDLRAYVITCQQDQIGMGTIDGIDCFPQ
jgi:hypothetical protein